MGLNVVRARTPNGEGDESCPSATDFSLSSSSAAEACADYGRSKLIRRSGDIVLIRCIGLAKSNNGYLSGSSSGPLDPLLLAVVGRDIRLGLC